MLTFIVASKYGYGLHEKDVPASIRNSPKAGIVSPATSPWHHELKLTGKVFWCIQVTTKLPLLFSKVSVCLLYRQLLRRVDTTIVRISRIVNDLTIILIVLFFASITMSTVFQCIPIQKSWLQTPPGHCVNITAVLYVTSAVNILTSILIIAIPLPVLFQTRYQRTEVKQLIALVLLGLVWVILPCIYPHHAHHP